MLFEILYKQICIALKSYCMTHIAWNFIYVTLKFYCKIYVAWNFILYEYKLTTLNNIGSTYCIYIFFNSTILIKQKIVES